MLELGTLTTIVTLYILSTGGHVTDRRNGPPPPFKELPGVGVKDGSVTEK